jgi:phosphodiesterase/alkaline phosphatase D-like protein
VARGAGDSLNARWKRGAGVPAGGLHRIGTRPSRPVQDAALRENPWIKFNANRRGYVRCTLTRSQYVADFRTLSRS